MITIPVGTTGLSITMGHDHCIDAPPESWERPEPPAERLDDREVIEKLYTALTAAYTWITEPETVIWDGASETYVSTKRYRAVDRNELLKQMAEALDAARGKS